MLLSGEATTDEPEYWSNPFSGVQLYVLAPYATIGAEDPGQISMLAALTPTGMLSITTMVCVAVSEQVVAGSA